MRKKVKKEVVVKWPDESVAPKLSEAESQTLNRFKVQGTLSQDEALEYHRLLNNE